MNRETFIARHEAVWTRTEELLERLESGLSWQSVHLESELGELPALYRRCCHHLAIVRQRHYGAALESRLNRIALRGYHRLYRQRRRSLDAVLRFLVEGFPRTLRRHAASFWLVSLLFYGAGVASGVLILEDPDAIYAVLDAEQVAMFEEMYHQAPDEERGSAADLQMFGFYIYNNVSIAFRTFAAGIFAGIGTLFIVLFNGLLLGAVFAHLTHVGTADNLLGFVIAHGAFELTAIVIAGVAGLHLGAAVVAPRRVPRAEALRRAAPECLQLLGGAAALLLVAAFVEAFWSSTAWVPFTGKVLVGLVAWIGVGLYLWRAGRGPVVDGPGIGRHGS
ncbi:MAG: stage II sporulation protein M [Acidobacteriota bacterium]